MDALLNKLRTDFPTLLFVPGDTCKWDPEAREITYIPAGGTENLFALLHELGHALLEHDSYSSDVELIRKEVDAWNKARKICNSYGITIDESYAQSCIDSYRDWLHARNKCPHCNMQGLQIKHTTYKCINCATAWRVTNTQICRPYRSKELANKKEIPFGGDL